VRKNACGISIEETVELKIERVLQMCQGVRMNSDRPILSAVPFPITRTSNIPEWRDENAAMPPLRDDGAAMPQWREEDVPVRQFDVSDEWDDKWLRPLFTAPSQVPSSQPAKESSVVPSSQAPPSQVAKTESAPEKCVVKAPAKRADANAKLASRRLRPESSVVASSKVPSSQPAKTGNTWESMEPEAMPLNLRFLRWLFRVKLCAAKRYSTPHLVAHYFTGGAPHSFQVRDMSATGLYLQTSERWAPCTLIQLTLQRKGGSGGSPKDSISVLSELVRFDENGAGFNFVLPDYEYLCAYGLRPEETLDPKSMQRFMQKIGVRAS
jgi:hypothetical protein